MMFITAQIYLEHKIDPAFRARAQALLNVMNSGFGNLLGYLGTGWWFSNCTQQSTTRWPLFWTGIALCVVPTLIYLLVSPVRSLASDGPRIRPT